MKKTKLFAGLTLLFFLGVTSGVLSSALLAKHYFPGPPRHDKHPPKPEFVVRMLSRHLDLTEEQKKEIRPIAYDLHEEILALRAAVAPRAQKAFTPHLLRLRAKLSPEQKGKLDQMAREKLGFEIDSGKPVTLQKRPESGLQ